MQREHTEPPAGTVCTVKRLAGANCVLSSLLLFVSGSTDCICFATVGTNDPVTSALHIIVGQSCDVIHSNKITCLESKVNMEAIKPLLGS